MNGTNTGEKPGQGREEERVSANRHLKSSCPIQGIQFRGCAGDGTRQYATRLRNRKPTRSLKRTFDRDPYIYIYIFYLSIQFLLRSDPSSFSYGRSVNLDFWWPVLTLQRPFRPKDGWARATGAPLEALGRDPRMAWTGHPLTLGVLPGPNPPRWSKQAETWPDPRTSPAWTRMTTRLKRSRVRQLKVNSFRLVDWRLYRWGGRERRELSVGWLGSTFIEAGMKYRGPRLRRELFIAGMMLAFPCWH